MTPHPQIDFGLRILRAPLYRVTWTVEADSPKVGKYVDEQLRNFWDGHLRQITTSTFSYGVSCGELSDRVSRGQIVFDRFDDVHPQDAKPIRFTDGKHKGDWAGVRIKGITGDETSSLGFDLQAPHAWWFPGEAQFGNYWGIPRLKGAHEPFLEKVGKGGAIASRRLWFKKCAFRGGQIRHPMGKTEYEIQGGGTVAIDNQDLARQIVERYENGGTLALPNDKDEKGEYLWVFEPPGPNGEVGGILEYPKELDKEILRGLGIPPELVEASSVGSGWNGRAIPATQFYTSEDEVAQLIVKCADDQLIRPRVALNFGRQHIRRYRIKLQSLAQMIEQDPNQAGKMLQEPDSRQAMGPPAIPQQQPSAKQSPVQLSHEAAERLLDQFTRMQLSSEPDADESGELTDEHIDAIADILGGLFGDKALEMFDEGNWVQLSWNAADHPRGKNGRFIPRGSAEAVSAAKSSVKKILKGAKTADAHKQLVEHLGILNVKQLHELRKEHGLKVSATTKEALKQKIAERLGAKVKDVPTKTAKAKPVQTPAPKHEPIATKTEPANADSPPTTGKGFAAAKPEHREAALREAWEHQSLFIEHQDGLVTVPRLYHEAAKRMPGLKLEDFHKELERLSRERKLELHVENSPHTANEPHLSINKDDRLYHYARFKSGVQLSWVAEQTRTGTTKAVGQGEDTGKVLYGDNAAAALQAKREPKQADTPTERAKAPPVSASELSGLSEITPAEEKKAWPKITETFKAIRDAVYVKAVEGSLLASKLAPDIGDTADDYMNLKASVYGDMDAWKQHTGLGWGFTTTLIKHAIAGAFAAANLISAHRAVKRQEAGTVQMSHDGNDAFASAIEVLAAAIESVHQSLKINADVDRDELARLLKSRMEKRANAVA